LIVASASGIGPGSLCGTPYVSLELVKIATALQSGLAIGIPSLALSLSMSTSGISPGSSLGIPGVSAPSRGTPLGGPLPPHRGRPKTSPFADEDEDEALLLYTAS
jgi:hypothetical protein